MASEVAFFLFAAIAVIAAWRVVSSNDVMRAALALVVVLCAMTPLFLLLAAEFVAVVQVLVYVGAVIILFLFGIMLTRSPMQGTGVRQLRWSMNYSRRWPGGVLATVLFFNLWFALGDKFGDKEVHPSVGPASTSSTGLSLLTDHVIAFEAISLVLLAALIGAIVLARRES